MKTKIKTPALVLMVVIAVTVVAGNLFGSARTIPVPIEGDPIPGVDVSIEQTPGGIIVAQTQTNAQGIVEFPGIAPGKYIVKITDKRPPASNNYNSSKSNTAGVMVGPSPSGTIMFSGKTPGKMSIEIPRGGPLTVKVTAKEGKDPKSTIKPNPGT